MPPGTGNITRKSGGCGFEDKIVAQTLFLGASVASVNVSKGWSGQASQLTVNLIEDPTPVECKVSTLGSSSSNVHRQFPPPTALSIAVDTYRGPATASTSTMDAPNHYHACTGVDCYITKDGSAATDETFIEDRMVPGKVFYEFVEGSGVASKYWYNSDPGFLGVRNRIKPDGSYITGYDDSNTTLNKPYDLIGTPVYFRMGQLTFGGIVQSWGRTLNSGGKGFSVTVNGMESVLAHCYMILDNFAGAIYSKNSTGTDHVWAGPRNYAGRDGVSYWDTITNGNIPNVFNVYGFLESLGKGGFGGSRLNEDGIEANKIIDAIKVLTSADVSSTSSLFANTDGSDNKSEYKDFGPKSAFSPFGRIVVKSIQEQDTYKKVDPHEPGSPGFSRFGVIPPTPLKAAQDQEYYCQFTLDLSELPELPKDYRVSGPVMSILDFITQVTEEAGYDYHISLYPTYASRGVEDANGNPAIDPNTGNPITETVLLNVIKVHTISRLNQPRPNLIDNTIKQLQCAGWPISSIMVGQEQNETKAKKVLIGGKQQRLYQAKGLRLAYSQNSYILNPHSYEFVDYMYLGRKKMDPVNGRTRETAGSATKPYHHGKIRVPALLSMYNKSLSMHRNPGYTGWYSYNEDLQTSINLPLWSDTDSSWNDTNELESSQDDIISGNYKKSSIVKQDGDPNLNNDRFFPIYKDVICPFFGYVLDQEYSLDLSPDSNNDFRRIRPVYFDTWTGQFIIVLRIDELPITNLDLQGFYTIKGVSSFILTENEIRAAIAGFDNFLVFSLAKTYKNDIIEMVRRAYEVKYTEQYKAAFNMSEADAKAAAKDKTDWYWRLIGGNIAGPFNQTVDVAPDKGDGSASIEQEVMQDLQILHKFIADIGQHYGKKYMVTAPALRAYKDDQFADVVLPTQVGPAYVFSGGGKLYYNYQPTNDGAWEEYGNIIDDTISVGSSGWYILTDDVGKIKPIIGYNANDTFDYIRYNICQLTQAQLDDYTNNASNDPFWNFEGYNYIQSLVDGSCNKGKFVFPGINLSSLDSSSYLLQEVKTDANWEQLASYFGPGTGFTGFSYNFTNTASRDAWGYPIVDTGNQPISLKKIYLNTSVEENFIFIDPSGLSGPKILIDAPGLTVNSTSEEVAKDPNRTVISNVAAEDLSIYLHSVAPSNWDFEWIRFMSYYTGDVHKDTTVAGTDSEMLGSYAAAANQSANFVEIAPKAVHPFFVGIPIRHNQSTYGPWTNYPYNAWSGIFPSGEEIVQSSSLSSLSCSSTPVTIDSAKAKLAINNMIGPTDVEINEEFVPWTYGGMTSLDEAAYNHVTNNLNYQSVIETAQIDIPRLPLFGLGMGFSDDAVNPPIVGTTGVNITYTDYKDNADDSIGGPILDFTSGDTGLATRTSIHYDLSYTIFELTGLGSYVDGPIITNIQTSMGQGGITTTYTFRTYTPKIGLFNKQANDRLKKAAQLNLKRNKQLSKLQQQNANTSDVQSRFLQEKKFENATLSGSDLSSKLFGWSPSTVLIAQSHPYIRYPEREYPYLEPTGLFSSVTGLDTSSVPNPDSNPFKFPSSGDKGVLTSGDTSYLTNDLSNVILSEQLRFKTSVGMYELKEVDAQIKKDHGLQSLMSLDGIFSPVSFYPTLKTSTFSYGLYDIETCPFCKKTKKIPTKFAFRIAAGNTIKETNINIYCDKCGGYFTNPLYKLTGTVTTTAGAQSIETLPPYVISSGTDINLLLQFKSLAGSSTATTTQTTTNTGGSAGVSIPINLVTLNPIVVPYGNMTNTNVQNYTGVHPEGSGVHEDLSIGIYSSSNPRRFKDRCRHSIEIVGRGAVKPKNLSIHNNLTNIKQSHQVDYYNKDIKLTAKRKEIEGLTVDYQMNQRFLGLRGPLVMHGWGYDLEGYPVPNAADEPYEIDKYGRPRRHKLKGEDTVNYADLRDGDKFYYGNRSWVYDSAIAAEPRRVIYLLGLEQQALGVAITRCQGNCVDPDPDRHQQCLDNCENNTTDFTDEDATTVLNTLSGYTNMVDDMKDTGGFMDDNMDGLDPLSGYQGSIISKTQKWIAQGQTTGSYPGGTGEWTAKKKLKEFYLNWAERPDLWPVGPIDLRWDEGRRVWTVKSSEAATIYKMVYVTLEEDLVPIEGSVETFPARAFLDDLEYSTEPLVDGQRRVVYVKDRTAYSAPRGAKLLCRYDKSSGFYEPVSKPAFVAKGTLAANSNIAALSMSYAAGLRSGESYPITRVAYENPLGLSIGSTGLFSFINGKWTLTASG